MGPTVLALSLVAGCASSSRSITDHAASSADAESGSVERARGPSPRLPLGGLAGIGDQIDSYFEGQGTRRLYVQLDRPLYKPGDTIWIKSWSVKTRGLEPDLQPVVTYELLDPQGQVVATKRMSQVGGTATNDVVLDPGAPGGAWTLRATSPTGDVDERPFVVSTYATPRIRKELEFVREAYGPGDRVEALVELEHGTGGPLAEHPVRALLQVAGQTVSDTTLTTDATGAVLVGATLPASLSSSDGLLTVMVEQGGITESISRSVPIVLADLALDFFPEGGDLVQGLPSRVYFAATNRHGEPADVEGQVEDARGRSVGTFRSTHDGLGRLSLTPVAGQRYVARITSPEGLEDRPFPLPEVRSAGCVMRAYDDLASREPAVRVGVRCTTEQEVLVTGVLRETALDAARVKAGPKQPAMVYLDPGEHSDAQGAVRVTVFDAEHRPLTERLVYRNHGRNLQIEVTPDQERYGPRDPVVLTVQTRDPSGAPVAAELALAVVDDAVIGLADDEEGHMLTRLYLEPELVDSPKDPAFYFDPDEALAPRAMDLVMGTKGHRRFEWRPVWDHVASPELAVTEETSTSTGQARVARLPRRPVMPVVMDEAMEIPAAEPAPQPSAVAPIEVVPAQRGARRPPEKRQRQIGQQKAKRERADHAFGAKVDDLQALGYIEAEEDLAIEVARVFPKPDYRAGFTGVRSDFRDTVHWEPTVRTDASGAAKVAFYLSDAVTTFRVTAEGLGQGHAGHHEATLSSVLPVSIATRLPAAVSAGDRLDVPITVSSTRDTPLEVQVRGTFDSDVVTAREPEGALTLPGGAVDTYWIPLEVADGRETVPVRLVAEGGGLSDTVEHTLEVVPTGFPQRWTVSGEGARETYTFQLDEVVPGSLQAVATWHPSPVSTLIEGMEHMIGTPGGCFEQTSSTNWPNVAILSYLDAHDGDPRLKVASHRALKIGHDKLVGYQVEAGGFETWGQGPGKEVLSAFGLLQFRDMARVFPVSDAILSKDAAYLLAQRNGAGGFENSGESAHGYGSAPAEILDGFITYALVDTGHADELGAEIEHQATVARTTDDPYVLALAVRSLQGAEHAGTTAAARRLAELQAEDGSFPGAASSITRSYEANLLVESTALSALALMHAGGHRGVVDKAAAWLVDNRQGGSWGATQATALALGALTAHADRRRVPREAGVVSLEINGRSVGTLSYGAEHSEALEVDDWARALKRGTNTVTVRQLEGPALPFALEVAWKTESPASAPGAELGLATTMSQSTVSMGDTVRLTATVHNRAGRVVPSPIARIGLPAGLEAQTWQLEQLQERGEVAFFETRPREVTLYWDGIHEDEVHEVALDLVAVVPGRFTAPASRAYPYYNDDEKAWSAGPTVTIER